jgi:hypothetical protein
MDTMAAATRWASSWERAWMDADVASIAALYAPGATYRSSLLREPEPGGAHGFASRTFAEESDVTCWFGAPIASGTRATVEWWATLLEDRRPITLVGVTVLTFDDTGLVVDHVDSWMQADGHVLPYAGWAAGRADQ